MSASIKKIFFWVDNCDAALKFWHTVLGLPIETPKTAVGYASLWMSGCLLEIQELQQVHRDALTQAAVVLGGLPPQVKPGVLMRFDIEVVNLANLRTSLNNNQVVFTDSATNPGNIPFVTIDVSGVFVRAFEMPPTG